MYRKHATIHHAKDATEQRLRPEWHRLVYEIRAWPDYNILKADDFKTLLPLYEEVGDISGKLDIDNIVDTSYAEEAMKELGKQGL